MARDDLEYLTLVDFTPGIYSKYGATPNGLSPVNAKGTDQLGKDGAAQIEDGRGNYTFGCYPDPDGGLRPLPRRTARYGTTGGFTLIDMDNGTDDWNTHPVERGVGVGDGGRRSKIGVIDALVLSGERFDALTRDAPPFRRDGAHNVRPDMLHFLTSHREDPVPISEDASSMFPELGRLVNRWHLWTLSELTTLDGDHDLSTLGMSGGSHWIVQQRAARYEEGSYGSGVGSTATFTLPQDTDWAYATTFFNNWRAPSAPLHDGWAAGSLAVGRSIREVIDDDEITLDLVKSPGVIHVVGCLQSYAPWMGVEIQEEVMPNIFSAVGNLAPFGTTNSATSYPKYSTFTGSAAGLWTAWQVPWYLIEHQDRFVGVIQDVETQTQALLPGDFFPTKIWKQATNRIRYTELNGLMRAWAPTTDPNNSTNGRMGRYLELWKFQKLEGSFTALFGSGGTVLGAPSEPPSDVLGNNLVERIGAMFGWQGDLIIVSQSGEGSVVRGSLEDPTVTRTSTIEPTGGITVHAVQTPKGVIYGSTNGVYLWTGEASEHVSPQLDGWFWDCGEASETHLDGYRRKGNASMGRFGYSFPFVYAPNDWVMDIRTGAWTRLRNPVDPNPYPYMHYLTNATGDIYAVRGCFDGSAMEMTEESYFVDLYSHDRRAWEWQWVSQPLQSSITREMKVMEVVVVAQGRGEIEVVITGTNDEENTQFTCAFDDENKARRVTTMVDARAEDIVVRVHATGQGTEDAPLTEAPTLHAIHIGSMPGFQVERN